MSGVLESLFERLGTLRWERRDPWPCNFEFLRSQGVSIHSYPETIRLANSRTGAGAFEFVLRGPPGSYLVQMTADFTSWTDLQPLANTTGTAAYSDAALSDRTQRFYRVLSQP
jgi:hypothetical protein